MRVEVPMGYKVGEIAYAAGVLVDGLTKTGVPGTETWPVVRDLWVDHIRGTRPYGNDLVAKGLKVGYRGYLDNLKQLEEKGAQLLLEEPRIIVLTDQKELSYRQIIDVSEVLKEVSDSCNLIEKLPPTALIFSKWVYGTDIVDINTDFLGLQ
jgi:hypothetical protein